MITSESVHWPNPPTSPFESCCVLEDRFMLLGHATQGVQLMDLARSEQDRKTILWLRIRQMIVIPSCRTVLMLGGRNKRVRCYSLDGLLRLCYAVLDLDWSTRREPEYDVPSMEAWRQMTKGVDCAPNEIQSTVESAAVQHQDSITTNHVTLAGSSTLGKLRYVCNDIILEDLCYKFPDCRDVQSLHIYQTSNYVFVAVLQRDRIVVWQRPRDRHQLRPFNRLKVYWIPAEPRFVSFADDRVTLRYIAAVFPAEATIIGLRTSKVQSIPVDKKLSQLYQTNWLLEQYEQQLLSAHGPSNSAASRARSHSLSHQQSTVPISVSSFFPALPTSPPANFQWTSLIQLPFYPDNIPTTSLTTNYSNPPSYDTVVTSSPTEASDPVALSSTVSPQLFFATFGRQSYIIDLSGALYSTLVYRWSQEPEHIEFIYLREQNAWFIVGFGRESIELIDFQTAEPSHRVMHGVPVRFLFRWDDKSCDFRALFWTCFFSSQNNKACVYMLQQQ